MTCDVYASDVDPEALVVVPAGAATTAVPARAGLGELSPLRIAVDLDDLFAAGRERTERRAEIEIQGYAIVARANVC